jgi:hypothetical protein
MKLSKKFAHLTFSFLVISFVLVSCSKTDDDSISTNEPINILQPDTNVVIAQAGSTFNFSLYLATDVIIDTVRVGYIIDTVIINQSTPFSLVDTVVLNTGFDTKNNVQTFQSSFVLPSQAFPDRPFRPYMPAQQNPIFVAAQYDALRVVFRVEASGKTFEKQMKIIIQ